MRCATKHQANRYYRTVILVFGILIFVIAVFHTWSVLQNDRRAKIPNESMKNMKRKKEKKKFKIKINKIVYTALKCNIYI